MVATTPLPTVLVAHTLAIPLLQVELTTTLVKEIMDGSNT